MKYLLGIDFGGGASKATLLSTDGIIKAENTTEYPTLFPKSGWNEQNPEDWYEAACINIKSIIEKSGISASDIIAVSLDAATHTAVLTDDRFNVLMPSIYWTDTRSKKQANKIQNNQLIIEKTFNKPSTVWTLPQIMWIRDERPDIFKQIRHIMFAKDYVRHRLTGDNVTDYIEAEGSMFFDYNSMCWSDELCKLADIDINWLPDVVSPDDIAGKINSEASIDTGLIEGTPVLCGTTDTVMEVLASGAVEEKNITIKLATAGRICVITGKPFPDKNLVNYSHVIKGLWYPGTATKACASSYRWFRDNFGDDYRTLDKLAENIGIGADGLFYHPYLNGEMTPYNDPELCASFTGIRMNHNKGHFARAVLEGVAFSLLECKNVLDDLKIPYDNSAVIIGGGSKSPLWRQIVSDILGIKLIEKKCSDSSLGSAIMAGVSMGVFKDFKTASLMCSEVLSMTIPDMNNHNEYLKLFEKYKKIQNALAPVYHNL